MAENRNRRKKPHNKGDGERIRRRIRTGRPGPLLAPVPAVMVSCGDMTDSNIITIAWTGIINSDPPMTYISVRKSRHSHGIILKNREFVINLVTEELAFAADYCGVRTGADHDKFREMKLTKEPADEVGSPMIAESPVSLECRVFEVKELPSHDMFLAEIVAVHIDDSFVSGNGAYRFDRMGLAGYSHGSYYRMGAKPIGRFGFSVMKPRTRRRKRRGDR